MNENELVIGSLSELQARAGYPSGDAPAVARAPARSATGHAQRSACSVRAPASTG